MTAVRLFAALRDAAGTATTTSDATTVAGVLADLRTRYGEPFTTRSRRVTVVVGDDPVPPESDDPLPPGVEVVLLPPFSGGS